MIISPHRIVVFTKFDDILFLNDLQNDLNSFSANSSDVDEDFSTWHRIIMKHLNNHAPIKTKRVKRKRLPEWYTPEITLTQRLRDNSKRRKQWSEYKHYRNKTRDLIRSAKRKYFSESIINTKDSKFTWKHLHSINSPTTNSSKTLPDELIINGQKITNSENVAAKLNDFFSSITDILNKNSDESPNFEKLHRQTDSKTPEGTLFHIPPITCDQVASFISRLDASKATGIDGLGPRIIRLAAHVIAPSITKLINRSIITGIFPSQLKLAKFFLFIKGGPNQIPRITDLYLFYRRFQKYLKNILITI